MSADKITKTQKPLRILTDAAPEHVERLRAQGHNVGEMEQPDPAKVVHLIIAVNAWHLPTDAPDPAAFIDAAVRWMQKRVYCTRRAENAPTRMGQETNRKYDEKHQSVARMDAPSSRIRHVRP